MAKSRPYPKGPMRADEIREGDPYELSKGHAILCLPTGGRGSDAAATGAAVLKSDPAVEEAGVETGYSPAPDTLRAPDVAVGNVPDRPGWVEGAPPLAVEYADTGQDERDLQIKIRELMAAGTRLVWVVRLVGARRVEVHEVGRAVRVARPGEELAAPGILKNPVPIEALYDWDVGREVTLRNLLQRHGYDDLDAVRHAGEAEGRASELRAAIFDVFVARGLETSASTRQAVENCADLETLRRWHRRATVAASADEMFADR